MARSKRGHDSARETSGQICYNDFTTELKDKAISSRAAPTDADIAAWQAMSNTEREAVLREKAIRATTSSARTLTAEEFLAEAKARLADG